MVLASARLSALRHAPAVATVVLVLSLAGAGSALAAGRVLEPTPHVDAGDLVYVACQVLPYGAVGAVLVARRPDLPFGWLLSLGAMALVAVLAIAGPAIVALEHGHGGQWAVWGLTAGSLLFVPAALEGLVNVRFPSGAPTGRWGRWLERAIVAGIVLALLGGVLGDSTVRSVYPDGPPGGASRFVDGSPLVGVANATQLAIPTVILLGILAGIGVVVRFLRSDGVERLQLRWRAVGVLGSLALFPLVVTEALPGVADDVVSDLAPLWFVATLVVPVLRYDLWAIDSIVRRSAAATFAPPATVVQSMVHATAEMLRLPHVAVRHGDRVLASHGEAGGTVEAWPLLLDGESVGALVATPRHGFDAIADADRQVLATLAQLVGGVVRAEALTADLLDARQRLVTAREEERRRLRRDLHDGLGPLLTGLGLNLDAATAQLGRSEADLAAYLGNAKAASAQVITDLRGLVDGLRPAALDELGLAGALKLHLDGLAADAGLALDLRIPNDLALPAAVEVAAFRTVVEAVTNTARHSGAGRVRVELGGPADALAVTVSDDGPDRSAWAPGVGLTGMRERAEELGGTFTAGPTSGGGRIRATYPLGGGS
jgi:signal transduction histidine kinase